MKVNLKNTGVIILLILLLCLPAIGQAQKAPAYQSTRILFVMDASGSMQGKWQNDTKFKIARDILVNVLDSLYAQNENIEFGLRLFGHLSPKSEKNCEDTRLEIPFAKENKKQFKNVLSSIKTQGQTPIAFSLFQAINDFPEDPHAKNVIILITDGLESCDGNPCAVTPLLKQNNIALRPFVIGLGLELENEDYFDCVGKFFNANDKPSLEKVMNVVISQAMNNTTAEIRLLDENGKPTIYDMPLSLYNSRTRDPELHLYNAKGYRGAADTIFLSPVLNYDIQVHSLPTKWKRNVTIEPGIHNIIPIDLPLGYVEIKRQGFRRMNDANCLIRDENHQLLDVMQLNNYKRILAGTYTVEILTLPRMKQKVTIAPGETTTIEVPNAGKAVFSSSRPGIYSVYHMNNGEPELIYENENLQRKETLELLPGNYFAVYRQYKYKSSELTEVKEFTINSRSSVSIWF